MSNQKSESNQPNPSECRELAIKGELTIQRVVEIREVICDAFSEGGNLTLDLQRVTDIDLTGLQLLCSAHISSITRGKEFSVKFPAEESIKNIVNDAGFLRHTGCAGDVKHTCIWTGGEERWAK